MTDDKTISTSQEQPKPSPLVANNPAPSTDTNSSDMRKQIEEEMKSELLRELSLDDVRNLVAMARTGVLMGSDAPDMFDEYDRNLGRMVRRVQRMAPGGALYWEERPIAKTLAEAAKDRKDWFDPSNKVWIREGKYREKDYPENTVEYWAERSNQIGAKT
jgi:hypothetical protein